MSKLTGFRKLKLNSIWALQAMNCNCLIKIVELNEQQETDSKKDAVWQTTIASFGAN